jgi:putative ABC transport system ATP-binding protein
MNQANDLIIRVRDVHKSYPVGDGQFPVLQGVTFAVPAGSFVAITGPSGNGKSTLLNMITGIDHPTAGQVVVAGHPLHKMNENELARWRGQHLGIVFQFFQLMPALSLVQNVIMPMDFLGDRPRRRRRERAMHLLDLVGLADHADKLPGSISGGQQQRVAIARALANDPPLIVADEPTGNLDSRTSDEVFDLFSHLVDQGKTLVMVTHDPELARRVPRLLEIDNGRIARDTAAFRPAANGQPSRQESGRPESGRPESAGR